MQPRAGCIVAEMLTQHHHHQRAFQVLADRARTRTERTEFVLDRQQQRARRDHRGICGGAQHDQRRQHRPGEAVEQLVEPQPPTDQLRLRLGAVTAQLHPIGIGDAQAGNAQLLAQGGDAVHGMALAMRQQRDVAGGQRDRRAVIDVQHAATGDHQVEPGPADRLGDRMVGPPSLAEAADRLHFRADPQQRSQRVDWVMGARGAQPLPRESATDCQRPGQGKINPEIRAVDPLRNSAAPIIGLRFPL